MSGIIDSLNPRQREAVTYCDGPQVVLAGAGSGKTKVLTTKIAYLVKEVGVRPWRILALTFTNKAAREMKSRAEAMFDGELGGLEISTFHSYGLRFLHRYHDALEKLGYPYPFVIFDRGDAKSVVKRAMNDLNIDPKKLSIAEALDMISKAKTKANPVSREPSISDRWRSLYDAYQNALKTQGALDFDDLMVLPLHILATDKDVLAHERERLDWVLVDEYQDVNMPQYLLLRCLVDGGRKIMVVGDPDQSIYGWRGAEMSMILNFERDFKGSKLTILDQNYRSTGNILDGANGVIRNNDDRHPKDLWTASERGCKIQVKRLSDNEDENEWIATCIEKLHDEGYRYGEMAILYRINAMSAVMENSLLRHSIPHKIIRGVAFYERPEVKDAISMLRLAVNPLDGISLARVAKIPARGLGESSIAKLQDAMSKMIHESAEELWREVERTGARLKSKPALGAKSLASDMLAILANKNNTGDAIRAILYTNGYENYLHDKYHDDWEERIENVMEILSLITPESNIVDALTELPLMTDQDSSEMIQDSVSMLTLHAAKGLEYPVVFMAGMEEGIFPTARAVEGVGDISEERRLCYVGMTRARERLYMSCAASRMLFGGWQHNSMSRFLGEIPQEVKEFTDEAWEKNNADNRSDRRRWRW
ncbi:UvrD-helicase domain-containing protein [Cloacibacillus sp. An23]|uniref:ATP-dependent helicase n=1 Tax=Cloacibacillus sp. An23 TaxID=1965591 RepID=UPI000B38DDC1|nr:UvrD-helicase domain-containing protein [Cloacibacillus sp. An23]OUO92928.1 ATP-dependent DNA helicase PcrA [Cloacibacillus sp. An23]